MSTILVGDCIEQLRTLDAGSVHMCVTSPPYWGLRDYGADGQIGLEETPEAWVSKMVEVFREVRRVLRDDGTLWLNLGDAYAQGEIRNRNGEGDIPRPCREHVAQTGRKPEHGLKPKDLLGLPWRVAFALQADGWYLRSDIIWAKPNPMPESVTDRPTKSHEYVFLLSKRARYYFDADAIAEDTLASSLERCEAGFVTSARDDDTEAVSIGANKRTRYGLREKFVAKPRRNIRTVWTIPTHPFPGAHFATFPPELIRPCIRAGSPPGGTVLDPFFGSGTTGLVCDQEGREWVGIELNPEYAEMARRRLNEKQELLGGTQ